MSFITDVNWVMLSRINLIFDTLNNKVSYLVVMYGDRYNFFFVTVKVLIQVNISMRVHYI